MINVVEWSSVPRILGMVGYIDHFNELMRGMSSLFLGRGQCLIYVPSPPLDVCGPFYPMIWTLLDDVQWTSIISISFDYYAQLVLKMPVKFLSRAKIIPA